MGAKFDMLNIKLDRILKALDIVAAGKMMAQAPEAPKAPKAEVKAEAKTPVKTEAKSVIKKLKSGKDKKKASKK